MDEEVFIGEQDGLQGLEIKVQVKTTLKKEKILILVERYIVKLQN